MQMAATKVWTLEELHSLPDDGNKYELVHGELFVTPAPTQDHETIASRLTEILTPYVKVNGLGLIYRPRAIIRYRGSEVEPDLMVRQPAPAGTSWDTAPIPILVVEILSPSTRRRDREHKRELYAEIGIRDYWIVDPESGTVTHVRSGRADVTSAETLIWHPDVVMPLTIDVPRLFE